MTAEQTAAYAQQLGVQNAKLQMETARRSAWAKFADFAQPTNQTHQNYTLPGNPIIVIEGQSNIGQNNSRLVSTPMLRQLNGYGVQGKKQQEGAEEDLHTLWMQMPVHFKRHGINLPHVSDNVDVNWLKIYKEYIHVMADWWGSYEDHDVTRAIYEGFSKHITDPVLLSDPNGGGLGWTKRYNKNFWIWDVVAKDFATNSPAFSFDSPTFKASIITKLGTLDAADKMSYNTIVAAGEMADAEGIKPWNIEGEDVFCMFINGKQELQLRLDQQWLDIQSESALPKNPIFRNALGRISNVIIFKNNNVARIAFATGSTLDFFDYTGGLVGAPGQFKRPQSAGANQHAACSILFGADMMHKAHPMVEDPYSDAPVATTNRLKFIKSSKDYDAIKGLSAGQTYGFGRRDFYDQPLNGETVPADQITPNCAVVVTYV